MTLPVNILLTIFMLLSPVSMARLKQQNISPDTIPPLLFTVADIGILPGDTTCYRITFYQSARFYKLMRKNKNCKQSLLLLQRSKKTNKPVWVILTEKFGDVIGQVKKNSN